MIIIILRRSNVIFGTEAQIGRRRMYKRLKRITIRFSRFRVMIRIGTWGSSNVDFLCSLFGCENNNNLWIVVHCAWLQMTMRLIRWTLFLLLLQTFRTTSSLFFVHKKFKHAIARQNRDCQRETVTFNSSFIEFMFAFLGIAQDQCSCDDPCPNASKYVKLYIYNPYVFCSVDASDSIQYYQILLFLLGVQWYKQFPKAIRKWLECIFNWS